MKYKFFCTLYRFNPGDCFPLSRARDIYTNIEEAYVINLYNVMESVFTPR